MAWTTPRDWTNHEFVTAAMMNTLSDNFDEVETAKVLAAGWTFYASAANTIVGLAPGDAGDVAVVNASANGFAWTGRVPLQRPVFDNRSNTLSLFPSLTATAYKEIVTTGGYVLIVGAAMVDTTPANGQDIATIFRIQRGPAAGGTSESVLETPINYASSVNSNVITQPFPVFTVDAPEAGDWIYYLSAAYFYNGTTVTVTSKGRLAVVEF